ncbi:MAG: sulfatase [Planctomycetota bacterium]
MPLRRLRPVRPLLVAVVGAASAAAATRGGTGLDTPPRPNIVLLIADDLGWQDVSVPMHTEPTARNRRVRTPHLDLLARRGMVFTNAYASAPVCTPTRASILTGRSPGAMRITSTPGARRTTGPAGPLRDPAWRSDGLGAEDVTLPRLLSAAGYRTIHVGKGHFAAPGTPGADPTALGFDVSIGGRAAGGPGSYLAADDFGHRRRPAGNRHAGVPGLERHHGSDLFLTEALAIEAGRAIEAAVTEGRPFFLYLATYAVHRPITPNPRHHRDLDVRHPIELSYLTMIESVDAALGAVVARLEALGVADRTVVIFTSDNGGISPLGFPDHNAPLKGIKGSPYEGGLRVPTVVAWPGVTDGGRRCTVPIVSHDLFPTLLAMAGADPPAEHAALVEGEDLSGLLRDLGGPPPDRPLFWHHPHVRPPSHLPSIAFTAVRAGPWKLIYLHANGTFLLFDLEADVGETANLAARHPERVDALADRLGAWCGLVDAQMAIRRATGRPVPRPDEQRARRAGPRGGPPAESPGG